MPRLALTLACLLAAPAWAEQAAPVPAAAATEAAPAPAKKKPRLICRTVEKTGTRLGATKQCETAAEWARMKGEHRQATEKYQENIGIRY